MKGGEEEIKPDERKKNKDEKKSGEEERGKRQGWSSIITKFEMFKGRRAFRIMRLVGGEEGEVGYLLISRQYCR